MKFVKIILCLLIFSSCNAPRAFYDYDEQVNFQSYSAYALYPDLRTGLSQLDQDRLVNSLKNALPDAGLSPSEDPDIYVDFYTEEYRERSRNSLGVGVGGGRGNVGVGVSGGIPIGGPVTWLRLTFDFIDVREDSLVWQAVVESQFDPDASPEERQARFDRMVQEALKGFPPKD